MNLKLLTTSVLLLWGCSAFAQWNSRSFPFLQTSYSAQTAGNTRILSGYNEIYKSTDAGQTWTQTTVQFTNYDSSVPWLYFITKVMFVSESTAFGFSNPVGVNTIFKSADGGVNWTLVYAGNGDGINNIQWVSENVGYAVGDEGKILKTTNGGDSWTALSSPTTNDLNSLHFLDNNNGVVVGEEVILKTSNGGDTWEVITSDEDYSAVFLISSEVGLIKGTNGIKPYVFDASSNLNFNFNFNHIAKSELYFTDALTGYYSSADGLFRTIDGGSFWSQQENTAGYQIGSFDFYDSNNAIITAYENTPPYTKTLFVTTTGGDPMPNNNARLLDIKAYPEYLCRGEYSVEVRIVNEGINNLTSTQLRWSVDGLEQEALLWTGDLEPGDTSELITVGEYNFNKTSRDFDVTVWTNQPNGEADDNPANDSRTVTYHFAAFTGSYFIGGAGSDFATISEAMQLMTNHGVCGDVTFNFREGTYTNTPISTDEWFYNLTQDYKLTFQSESGHPDDVTLEYTSGTSFDIHAIPNLSFLNLSVTLSGTASTISVSDIDSLVFRNCRIINSKSDANAHSVNLGYNTRRVYFHDNTLQGGQIGIFQYSGQAEYWASHWVIEGNTFRDQRGGGIRFETDIHRNLKIERNKFFASVDEDIYTGISLDNTSGTIISNNYFQLTSPEQASLVGISVRYGSPKIFHNTILVNTPSSSGLALGIVSTTSAAVKNNNLVNLGAGSIYSMSWGNVNSTIDFNNLYSRTGRIGTRNDFPVYHLTNWRSISGFDLNSISVDPQMVNDSTHIQLSTSNYALNGAGTPIEEVTHDIDGEPRDMQTPDIGVDEFDVPIADLGIEKILMDNMICSGEVNHSVRVTNYGQANVAGFELNWSVDGHQKDPVTVGPISSGSTIDVQLGVSTVTAGNHSLSVSLQASGDLTARNDTLTVSFEVGGISGVYTIGGTSPDYPTIMDAIAALEASGVCGDVTFNIRPGTYSEAIIFPPIPWASEDSQIIFQSELHDSSTVILDLSSTVILDGADWITLSHVTLKNNTTDADLLVLKNGADHNTIHSNHFMGDGRGIYSSSDSADEYNTFSNNVFDNPSGNSFYGCIVLAGLGRHERGNVITGNVLTGVTSLNYQHGFVFDHNHFQDGNGLTVNNCINHFLIRGNVINSPGDGIYIDNCLDYGNGEPSVVANNIVESVTNAVVIRTTNNVKLFNNTLVCSHDEGITVMVDAFSQDDKEIYRSVGIKNNIVIAKGSNATCLAIGQGINPESDYNVFYSTSKEHPFARPVDWGNPRSEFFDGLFLWQSNTGYDLHSLFLLPRFVSETDHHIMNDSRLKKRGTFTGIDTDIDGDVRDTSAPDVGADEFIVTPIPNDIGISNVVRPDGCTSSLSIKAKIKNYGSNVLTSATINWKVNQDNMPPVQWAGSLEPSAESSEIALGDFAFHPTDSAIFKIWTELPNGVADLETLNDTFLIDKTYQKLNGFYSIGGIEQDFQTLTSALDYLHRVGVCGPVTLTIKSGTYFEDLTWTEIPGASEQNRITLAADPAETEAVVLNWWNESSLKGTDYVTFESLTFSELPVLLTGECKGIQFISNTFISETQHLNFDEGSFPDLLIEGNAFESGVWGIVATSARNATIQNNTFVNVARGIRLITPDGITQILGNRLDGGVHSTNVEGSGIKLEYTMGSVSVQRNTILDYPNGLEIENSGSKANISIVANNMISATSTGIYSMMNRNHKFYHNSVRVENQNNPSYGFYAFYSWGDSLATIINNSFANYTTADQTGLAIYIDGLDKPSSDVDNNNLWSRMNRFGFDGETVYSLDEYKAISGVDTSSISVDPLYVSEHDLHASHPALNGRGLSAIDEVAIDFDGEARDPLHPDIGADEFETYPADAGIASIDFPAQMCLGANDVYVTVQNTGTGLLGSATIEWTVNGVPQTAFHWSGALMTGESSESIRIGTFDISEVAIHEVRVWTSMPNEQADPDTSNDEQVIDVLPAMSGLYTVGGNNPDYETIQDAVGDLKQYGVCGPVFVSIRPGVYTEQVVLKDIAGSSPQSRITFASETGNAADVIVNYSSSSAGENYVWLVEDQNYVSIQHLTLRPLSSEYGTAIKLSGTNIEDTEILNNKIELPANQSETIQFGSFGVHSEAVAYSYTIRDNSFSGGSGAIFLSNVTYPNTGGIRQDIIAGNYLVDQHMFGVMLHGYNSFLISDNEIVTATEKSPTYKAISVYNHPISSINSKITGNKLDIFGAGLHAESTIGTLIFNNFISVKNGSSPNGWRGISLTGCPDFKLLFNSVAVYDTHANSAPASIGANYLAGHPKSQIRSNVFANFGGGLALEVRDMEFSPLSQFMSDHNDWFTTGSEMGLWWYGTSIEHRFSTLASWVTTSGMDTHSLASDPLFVSPTDLHAQSEELVGAAVPHPSVPTDIDGQPRHIIHPTIGADEFGQLKNVDIRIASVSPSFICSTGAAVSFTMRNGGSETLTSCRVDWEVNGQVQAFKTWSGTMAHGATTVYSLPRPVLNPGEHTLKIVLSNPNGKTDEVLANNSIEYSFVIYDGVNLGNDIVQCSETGEEVMLDAGQFDSYFWNTGDTDRTITIAGAGSYSVSVTDANGCTHTDSMNLIREYADAVVHTPEGTTLCEGGSVTLQAEPAGYLYSWLKDDDAIATTRVIETSQEGVYKVRVFSAHCTFESETVELAIQAIPQTPVVTPNGPTAFCEGGNVNLAGPDNFGYNWSGGETTQEITVSQSGSYTLQVVDENGCVSLPSEAIEVTVNEYPAAIITKSDDKLIASDGDQFKWFLNGAVLLDETSQTLTPEASGSYAVEVTKNECSTVSDAISILITAIEADIQRQGLFFPNPADRFLQINIRPGESEIQLFDNLGKKVQLLYTEADDEYTIVNTADLLPGVYYLHVKLNDHWEYFKINVVH